MKSHIQKIVCYATFLAFPLLVSCVSTADKALSSSSVLQNKRVSSTYRDKPAFAAMTPGKAAFGVIGAAAMISSGNNIVRSNNVADPADGISKELMTAAIKKSGVKPVGTVKVTDENPASIAKLAPNADYVLDVRTINWSMVYYPMHLGTYRVIYSAKLRLIDCKTGKVVAEGFHARIPERNDQSPGYDDLVDHQAAGLKKELQIGAKEAEATFKSNILKL